MTGQKISDDELREALIERGHEKVAAALDESTTQRTRSRARLHAELLAEGYEASAAALKEAKQTGSDPASENETDMNTLIRRAAGREEIS